MTVNVILLTIKTIFMISLNPILLSLILMKSYTDIMKMFHYCAIDDRNIIIDFF